MAQPSLPSVVKAISQTIVDPITNLNRYSNMGTVDLHVKLNERLGLPMEQVAVGRGSSALYLQLVQTTYTDGGEVMLPWRDLEAYPTLIRIVGTTSAPVPLDAQSRSDLSTMVAAITDHTCPIFVCNPNSSTGTTITRKASAEPTAQAPGDAIIALDEAYIELVDEAAHAAIPLAHELLDTYPNLVGLHTFSKVYDLVGPRVGYMFGPEKLVKAVNEVAISFSVNTLAQIAALVSPDAQEEFSTHTAEAYTQRAVVTKAINAAVDREMVLPNSQANFIWIDKGRIMDLSLLDDVSVATTTDLDDFLAQCNTLVRCSADGGARTTITTEEETSQLLAVFGIKR